MKKLFTILCVALAAIMVCPTPAEAQKSRKKSHRSSSSTSKRATSKPMVSVCKDEDTDEVIVKFFKNGTIEIWNNMDGVYVEDEAYLIMTGNAAPLVAVGNELIYLGEYEPTADLQMYLMSNCGDILDAPQKLKEVMSFDPESYSLIYKVDGKKKTVPLTKVPEDQITTVYFVDSK